MAIVAGLDKLGGDADPPPSLKDRTFNHRIHVQLPGDLRQRLRGILVLHGGGSGNHPQPLQRRETSDQFVGKALRKVVLLRVTGKIFQWQHGDGADGACPGWRAAVNEDKRYQGSKYQGKTDQATDVAALAFGWSV